MNQLRSVKGMHDVLPEEMPKWHFLEDTFRRLTGLYGYREIRTPVLEPLELFVRGIGEATDIVEKEMYAFEDKGGDRLALRPEGTASVIRAFVQHGMQAREPVSKLYYIGPMFRRERPAKGRFRQFYQAGAELLGAAEPAADAEIIDMATRFLSALGIADVSVQLSSLGDRESRLAYRGALVECIEKRREELCGDCVRRLAVNPLRILDCKVESCRAVAADAPSVMDYLSGDAARHFAELCAALERFGTPFEVAPRMVRGLDYYTRTIFEIQGRSEALGAQATLVGGGRYDGLVSELGGPATPTIGFAFGLERLLLMLGDAAAPDARRPIFVAGVGEGGVDRAHDIARTLRAAGCPVEVAYAAASLKSQLKRADRVGARGVVIAGEDEASRGAVTWRDMRDGTQVELPVSELAARAEALR
ncbi:MAG: histidine--tRNA ligase [Proteobacteria bacterium]|jgi:histidyl-tRNA synthetase|nr:histidine--tRNA ligase [Pseudomonadota bacterium]